MAIRDHFRLDVVVRRAAELQAVDAELSSVEHQLGLGTTIPSAACPSCGGPVSVTAQYCGRCGSTIGRPAVASTPLSARPGTPAGGIQ
jgi:predicted amidophosphoribosyltransferase